MFTHTRDSPSPFPHWGSKVAVLPTSPNIYTDQCEPIVMYYFFLFWPLCNYAGHTADILTSITAIQGVDNHSWGLYFHHCYCICICWGYFCRIFHFSRWLGQLNTATTKEIVHTRYAFTPLIVFFTPYKYRTRYRRDLGFTFHPKHVFSLTFVPYCMASFCKNETRNVRNDQLIAWSTICIFSEE